MRQGAFEALTSFYYFSIVSEMYLTFSWFIEPKQEFEQGGFAAPAHTYNGRYFAFGDGEVNVFQDGVISRTGVGEREVLEVQPLP
jgi:hypothetical protein